MSGRLSGDQTIFNSHADLAAALRRPAAAHGEHERQTGARDENWPDWYACHLAREQSGQKEIRVSATPLDTR